MENCRCCLVDLLSYSNLQLGGDGNQYTWKRSGEHCRVGLHNDGETMALGQLFKI